MRKHRLLIKLLTGTFFMFTIYMTIKVSQISLDPFTDTHSRSIMINIGTAAADLTLCIFLDKFKGKTTKFLFVGNCLMIIVMIVSSSLDVDNTNTPFNIVQEVISVAMRYLSELCYGLILIWAIETFPTINRSLCVGIVVGGSSFGVILAYGIRQYYV